MNQKSIGAWVFCSGRTCGVVNGVFEYYFPSLRVMEEHLVQLISTKGFASLRKVLLPRILQPLITLRSI